MIPLIDIEDTSLQRLGSGPLTSAHSVQVTAELDRAGQVGVTVPATDPKAALIQAKRIMRVHGLIGGVQTTLGRGIIDHVGTRVSASEQQLEVQGDDLLRELTYNLVDGLELSKYDWLTPDAAQEVTTGVGETNLPNTLDGNPATFDTINLVAAAPRKYLYVGHSTKFSKVHLDLDAQLNSVTATLSAQYFDGEGWIGVAITDGTSSGGVTLRQDGDITWTEPIDQAQIRHSGAVRYWMRFTPSAALDPVDVQEITAWAKQGTTNCLQPIMALAPAGWSLDTGSWYGVTASPVYYAFGDNTTVLAALVKVAELTGEHFRLGTGRQVQWLQVDQPSSGLRAVVATSPDVEANNLVCLIQDLEETRDSFETVNRVYPYGGGLGPARLTLSGCTEGAPPGYTLNTVSNYIEKNGVTPRISRSQNFPELRSVDGLAIGDKEASNQLFRSALAWLQQRDVAHKFYSCTVTKLQRLLLPGETIRVRYLRVASDYVAIDIDADLYILSVTHQAQDDGLYAARLELATIDRRAETDTDLVVRELQRAVVAQTRFNQVDARALSAALVGNPAIEGALFKRSGQKPEITGDRAYDDWRRSMSVALETLGLANDNSGGATPTITGSRDGNPALGSLITALGNEGVVTDGTTGGVGAVRVRDNLGADLAPAKFEYGNVSGPASYASGGFVLDLSARFTSLAWFDLALEVPGSLPDCRFEIARNSPSAGKATIKLVRARYDKADAVGNVSGQPGGVTVQGTSGATVAAEAAHTHGPGSIAADNESAHTHVEGSTTASSLDFMGSGDAGIPGQTTAGGSAHGHTLTGTSAAGSSHLHADNNIYQHGHAQTATQTDAALVEVAAATNLSTTTWRYLALGT